MDNPRVLLIYNEPVLPKDHPDAASECDVIETAGSVEKILVDAGDRRILGGSILGVGGDEVIHCILDLMYAKAPYTVLQRAMHIHPTVSELIPTMLGELKPLT